MFVLFLALGNCKRFVEVSSGDFELAGKNSEIVGRSMIETVASEVQV